MKNTTEQRIRLNWPFQHVHSIFFSFFFFKTTFIKKIFFLGLDVDYILRDLFSLRSPPPSPLIFYLRFTFRLLNPFTYISTLNAKALHSSVKHFYETDLALAFYQRVLGFGSVLLPQIYSSLSGQATCIMSASTVCLFLTIRKVLPSVSACSCLFAHQKNTDP